MAVYYKDIEWTITDIKIYVPEKVMGVTITNLKARPYKDHEYKSVVKEPDSFSMEYGCALAIAKFLYSDIYTMAGIEHAAHDLLEIKPIVKEIRRAIRCYRLNQESKEKRIRELAEIEAIKKHRREKNARKREERRLKKIVE